MALELDGSSTDYIAHGSGASLDNIDSGTVLVWVYPHDTTAAYRTLMAKLDPAGTKGWIFRRDTSDGTVLKLSVVRASSNQTVDSTSVLTANAWQFLACTWSIASGSPAIYRGTLTALASDVSTGASDGSGSQVDDSAETMAVGGLSFFNAAFDGDIAVAMLYDRQMSLKEIQTLQFQPRVMDGNCVLYCQYGWAGTGTQPDWSGSGNDSTAEAIVGQADHVPLRAPWGADAVTLDAGAEPPTFALPVMGTDGIHDSIFGGQVVRAA